jgi:hypothetical protein
MKKSTFVFLTLCWLSWMLPACEQETVEPTTASARNPKGQQTVSPPVPPVPPAPNTPPPAPGKNCKVTIFNASSNPYAFLHIAVGSPDMDGLMAGAGCAITPGSSATVCLPQGEITLYPFSNMYQFGPGVKVNIGSAPITLRMRSGH